HPTLHRTHPTLTHFHTNLATLHTHGATTTTSTSSSSSTSSTPEPRTTLPSYPFRRETYWLTPPAAVTDAAQLGLEPTTHPLLRATLRAPDDSISHTSALTLADHPWLADHAVAHTVVLPGTALVDLALHTGSLHNTPHLDELTI
ncbi:polyketide synthase dehydratase domain-containing protein, partial [Frankia sp. Ag45/Mut15]